VLAIALLASKLEIASLFFFALYLFTLKCLGMVTHNLLNEQNLKIPVSVAA